MGSGQSQPRGYEGTLTHPDNSSREGTGGNGLYDDRKIEEKGK